MYIQYIYIYIYICPNHPTQWMKWEYSMAQAYALTLPIHCWCLRLHFTFAGFEDDGVIPQDVRPERKLSLP